MKELSIEEKARRYDEAIERGSRLWESDTITRESYEYIFPELKESENEKIRKELLNAFQKSEDSIYMRLTPYKRKSFIDWLEKQGAELSVYQNVLFKIATILSQHEDKEDSPLEQIRSIVVDGLVSAMDIEKQGEQKPEEIVNLHDYLYGEQKPVSIEMKTPEESLGIDSDTYNKIVDECVYGEKKPANKVEPKFKVGDWVVDNCGYTWKIEEILNQFYLLEDIEGGESRPTIEWVNKTFHLWIIEDAKDGDVLCDYCEEYDNPLIFILKKFERVDFGLVKPSDYSSYCFLTAGDMQRLKKGTYHHIHNIKPATKEQRDLLFQKMKEAGYEWDAEKKELKKNEPKFKVKPIRDGLKTEFQKQVSHLIASVLSEEYDYTIGYVQHVSQALLEYAKNELKLVGCTEKDEPKSAWSEEDEKIYSRIYDLIHAAAYANYDVDEDGKECGEYATLTDWLKSLKDRVQPKPNQEWSNWDKTIIESIEALCDEKIESVVYQDVKEHANDIKEWLKDLKEKYDKGKKL